MEIIDIHSHILPGVDDGSRNMQETLEMLRMASAEGISAIFATPHYRSGCILVKAKEVERRLQKVREQAAEEGIEIELYPGTEIYYRSGLEERLEDGSLARMNHSRRLLIEFSPMESFLYIRNAMEDIRGLDFIPILAHVERYQCFYKDPDKVVEIRNMGCEMQCNAGSVTGAYGFRMKRFVHGLLKNRLIDYIGTDAHDTGRRSPKIGQCKELLLKRYGAEYAEEILSGNARRNLLVTEEGGMT